MTSWSDRLGLLFDAHHQRLYGLARRLCHDAEEAHDLVQEAYFRAARRPASVPKDDDAAEAWLVRVLVNLCRDRQRRLRVRRHNPPPRETIDPSSGPESVTLARVTVQAALQRLSARRRAVLVLHELEEQPIARIAALLGLARATVRWHLAGARREMKKILQEDDS